MTAAGDGGPAARRTDRSGRPGDRKNGFTTVATVYGSIEVKLGTLNGKVVQAAPEFESCKEAAARAGVPLRSVYEAATIAVSESQAKEGGTP